MNELAVQHDSSEPGLEPIIRLLVADDDRLARSLISSRARETVEGIVVLEAEDGAQAVQVGLQQRPAIALFDVNMPRLGGIEAAVTLRELQPHMRLALHTADPLAYRERARAVDLPLFGKLELDSALAWLRAEVEWYANVQTPRKLDLTCAECGYGVIRSTPPRRCPMCQAEAAWIRPAWRAPTTVLTG